MQISSKKSWRWSLSRGSPDGRLSVRFEPGFWITLALAAVLYVCAACEANEWLYLLSCGLTLTCILGATLPLLQVLMVRIKYSLDSDATAMEGTELSLIVSRRPSSLKPRSFWAVRCLTVEPRLVRRGPPGYGGQVVTLPAVCLGVLADEDILRFALSVLRRGIYRCESVQVTSCFPFALVFWSRCLTPLCRGGESLTVYPAVVPLAGNFLADLGGISSAMGLSFESQLAALQSASVRSVRQYKSGDSPRRIHWPSSARQGRLLVREFDCETLPVFNVLLDLKSDWKDSEQFELAVCLVHSLIHMGFERDMPPDLLFNPPLQSSYMSDLMGDLPQMRSAAELLSDMLARAEPPQFWGVDRRELAGDWQAGAAPGISSRPTLTAVPSSDRIMKYSPQRGDHVVSPVLVVILSSDVQDQGSFSPALPPAPRIIGTVSGDSDIQAL